MYKRQELGIETNVKGIIEEKGIVALDAKLFSDIIRSFLHKGLFLCSMGDNRTIEMNIVMQAMNIKKVDMCM